MDTNDDLMANAIKETTDDWVETLTDPTTHTSHLARLSLFILPEGVDPEDERVEAILRQIRESNQ